MNQPLTTLSMPKIVDPGVRAHTLLSYNETVLDHTAFMGEVEQESKTDTYQGYSGLGEVQFTPERGNFKEDAPHQAYGTTVTPAKYGLMYTIPYEVMKWYKLKDVLDGAKLLGQSLSRHMNRVFAALGFNNGFNASYLSMDDNKSLYSVAHPGTYGGAAQSNASASGIPLTDENLEIGLLALEDQLGESGETLDIFATMLVVPNTLRKTALQILESDAIASKGTTVSTPSAINVYKSKSYEKYYGGKLDLFVTKYINAKHGGSDTAWFLVAENTKDNLFISWADKPTIETKNDYDFQAHVDKAYRGFVYYGTGWKDWRGRWGSKGDGQAFST